jgi:hypothetical protein
MKITKLTTKKPTAKSWSAISLSKSTTFTSLLPNRLAQLPNHPDINPIPSQPDTNPVVSLPDPTIVQ